MCCSSREKLPRPPTTGTRFPKCRGQKIGDATRAVPCLLAAIGSQRSCGIGDLIVSTNYARNLSVLNHASERRT